MARDPHPHSPVPARPAQLGAAVGGPATVGARRRRVLAAVIIGLVMGGLMFLHDKSVPAAVATGLVAAGGSVPVLHKLIG
ncbi:hypothetical protein ACTMTU_34840 [Streptomyces sp. OZ13]|uniref:hypothetical protein n=1 Tax=Streptomyces sp. OZ13 TaxID=3452210 RepID=UPI003F8C3980